MKRTLLFFLLAILLITSLSAVGDAQQKPKCPPPPAHGGKKTIKCPKTLNSIEDCLDTGCGSVDPLLNIRKNMTEGNLNNARDITFAEFAALPKLVDGYCHIGDPRKPLKDKGEGDMVRVVAWALDARPQKTRGNDENGKPKRGETCNCGFTGRDDPENTDVHIVLVDDETLKLKAKATAAKPATATKKAVPARSATQNTLKKREAQSQTAEFAPRLRVALHDRFDGAKLKSLINPAKGGRLQVRVTGLLMYDSEHAVGPNQLLRRSDWEVHPVFRLEFCPKGKICAGGDWINLNSAP